MYVYFIQSGDDGPIKIGITNNIEKRKYSLQTGNHHELNLLWSYEYQGNIALEEARLHEWFKYQHIRGEWFRPDKYLLSCIERMKNDDNFMDDWIDWEGSINLLEQRYREVARKYQKEGNYLAIKYIASQIYELYSDLMGGRF